LAVATLAGEKADHPDAGGPAEATIGPPSSALAAFSQEMFRAYWEFDENISQLEVIGAVAHRVGLDGPAVLKLSEAAATRDQLAVITDQAIARGVFGAPTFFVGNEMFWGKDRLDFVERWLMRRGSSSG
jgi:2-hydroxychromene-2-carboxylate isomerase